MADKVNDMNDKGKVRVFVYGSLKKGQPNAIVLRKAGAEFVGMDSITGKYQMISLGAFPGVTEVAEDIDKPETIYGEIWAGDEEMLAACDMLEGHPSFYERHKVWSDGGKYKNDELRKRVWIYLLPQEWEEEAEDVVEYGIWRPVDRDYEYWGTGLIGPQQTQGAHDNDKTANQGA